MSEKNTRGRASKVDLLPPNIKTQLAMMLRDKQYSQAEILEEINDLIRDCGLPENMQLSKTGLSRNIIASWVLILGGNKSNFAGTPSCIFFTHLKPPLNAV